MKTRRFDFVAFWDECAWVAGVTSHNEVAQGSTLNKAIESLKWQLGVNATYAEVYGKKPFIIEHDGMIVMEEFSKKRGLAVPQKGVEPKKGATYCGSFTVSWSPRPNRNEWKTLVKR